MTQLLQESVLLIGGGDAAQQVHAALAQAAPNATVTPVANVFDGIAELVAKQYTTVLASADPIERRPEAAVRQLRQIAGEARLILFADATLEPLSRKMLSFGVDDYIVTPAKPGELAQIFGAPPLRLAPAGAAEEAREGALPVSPPSRLAMLAGLPLTDIILDSMIQHPQGGAAQAIRQISARIGPAMALVHVANEEDVPDAPQGSVAFSSPLRVGGDDAGVLVLTAPIDEDANAARHFLAQIAHLISKVAQLEDRHVRLQRMAITDDLTGLANSRYFRHFLTAIIEKAKVMRFPVTLLLFDIDGFKSYNDKYGHAIGDDILRQTAALMKRCVRDHDLVARLGGDEFAVVFWEKEGPRVPREPKVSASGRVPQTARDIFERFRRLISSPEFGNLGATGKGTLTASGGMAVYPYDAQDVEGLIRAADEELVFRAKQNGKNCLRLVGDERDVSRPPPEEC